MWPQELVQERVSTHDLTKRSTTGKRTNCETHKRFNSRPHEEVDRTSKDVLQAKDCFNSRPHEEVDEQHCFVSLGCQMFQLTTSRRGRPAVASSNNVTNLFQLTTSRRGRRSFLASDTGDYYVSTHDLTKRSTISEALGYDVSIVSTHDLTKRSTRKTVDSNNNPCVSTHDLTKRSTFYP